MAVVNDACAPTGTFCVGDDVEVGSDGASCEARYPAGCTGDEVAIGSDGSSCGCSVIFVQAAVDTAAAGAGDACR